MISCNKLFVTTSTTWSLLPEAAHKLYTINQKNKQKEKDEKQKRVNMVEVGKNEISDKVISSPGVGRKSK